MAIFDSQIATEGTVRAAVAWGLKSDLTWADCIAEAHKISDARMDRSLQEESARRLIQYITERESAISEAAPQLSPKESKAELGTIRFHPAREPCTQLLEEVGACFEGKRQRGTLGRQRRAPADRPFAIRGGVVDGSAARGTRTLGLEGACNAQGFEASVRIR